MIERTVLDRAPYQSNRYMILHNPLCRRVKPWVAIAVIWSLSLVINIPTLVAMRVSEYFTPDRLVHCRIILKLDSNLTGLIRKYRVGLVVLAQYFIPLLIASIFYSLCIKQILARQKIGACPKCSNGLTDKLTSTIVRPIFFIRRMHKPTGGQPFVSHLPFSRHV